MNDFRVKLNLILFMSSCLSVLQITTSLLKSNQPRFKSNEIKITWFTLNEQDFFGYLSNESVLSSLDHSTDLLNIRERG